MLKKLIIIIMGLIIQFLNADEIVTVDKLNNIIPISDNLSWGETAEGKEYIFDKNNIITEGFNSVDSFNNGISVGSQIKDNKEYYIIDTKGNKLKKLEYEYAKIAFGENNITIGKKVNKKIKYGMIDKKYREVLKVEYDDILQTFGNEGLIKVRKGNNWGLFDENKNSFITKIKYDNISDNFNYGYIKVRTVEKAWFSNEIKNEKTFFIDKNGNELFYQNIIASPEGLISVSLDNKKYGIMDKDRNVIKEPEDIRIHQFNNGIAVFESNGLYGILDKKGKTILTPNYTLITDFSEERAIVRLGKLKGVINIKGEEIVKPKYDYIDFFQDGIASFQLGEKFGLFDYQGKIIVGAEYEKMSVGYYPLTEGYLSRDEKGMEILKFKGKSVPFHYGGFFFSNDLCLVKKNNLYGYIDRNGNEVIKCQYIDALPFSDELACIRDKNKTFFIDKTGKKIFEHNSYWNDDKKARGQIIRYSLNSFENGMVEFFQNEKYGYLDRQGNIIINPVLNSKYSIIKDYKNNVVKFKIKEKYFVYPLNIFFKTNI